MDICAAALFCLKNIAECYTTMLCKEWDIQKYEEYEELSPDILI